MRYFNSNVDALCTYKVIIIPFVVSLMTRGIRSRLRPTGIVRRMSGPSGSQSATFTFVVYCWSGTFIFVVSLNDGLQKTGLNHFLDSILGVFWLDLRRLEKGVWVGWKRRSHRERQDASHKEIC
jgi:hypothetical protein